MKKKTRISSGVKRNNKKAHAHFWIIAGFAFVLAICLMANHNSKVEAAPNSTVYFNPASVSRTLNGTFNLDAVINPGTNQVSAVELHVVFDRTRVRVNSISANTTAFPDILQVGTYDNNAGTASIIVGSGSTNYITSTSTIATLSFTAIGSGTSNVDLTGTMAAARNESSDVITTRTGAQVTVASRTYGIADFTILAADWLQTKSSPADVNSDGVINGRDLGIMMHSWQ
jgi:hypothetical protein